MGEVIVGRAALALQALAQRRQIHQREVMLIVLELDERAPQRAVDVEDVGEALPLGVLRGADVDCDEDEPDRARDEDGDQPQGDIRAGADLH